MESLALFVSLMAAAIVLVVAFIQLCTHFNWFAEGNDREA